MPMSPQQMGEAIIRNLPEKTGHPLEYWVGLVKQRGIHTGKENIDWLKKEHGLGHIQALIVVGRAFRPAGWRPKSPEEIVDVQYSGKKAHLRPIFERLTGLFRELGDDVEFGYRKTYVSVICGRQFATIQPVTNGRIDLSLRLDNVKAQRILEPAGSSGSGSVTHKIAITAANEVNSEVDRWLRRAYNAARKI